MRTTAAEKGQTPSSIHLPPEIDWEMLDKSRFFILGAALFSAVSVAQYPAIVLKTRLQICKTPIPCFRAAASILRREGSSGFYRGFATSLAGTVPARALYMTALELTKTAVGSATIRLGFPDPAAAAASNAAAGLAASVAAQIVWTPIDVISQRLMVPGGELPRGGVDEFRRIIRSDGLRGLYRGFGMSILTYAPSNAVWWATYSMSQRVIWSGAGYWFSCCGDCGVARPGRGTVAAVQGASAAIAGGAAAVATMPMDTVKTWMQVKGGETVGGAVRSLVKEGGWLACYRGLGPRWASMSVSSICMISTYEMVKRLAVKNQVSFD